MRFPRAFVLLLSLVVGNACSAAEPARNIIGAEVYFQQPIFRQPMLSPDGRRLIAGARHDDRHYALAMVNLETGKTDILIKETSISVSGYGWKSDDLLIVVLSRDGLRPSLESVDLRTRKINPLDRLNEQGDLPIVSFLAGDPTDVLCRWTDGQLRRVNVLTGKSQPVERAVLGIDNWIVNAAGTAWAGIGYLGEKWIFIWRSSPTEPWQRREQPGRHQPRIYPVGVMPDSKRLVVLERTDGRPARLAFFDLKTAATQEIYQDARCDVAGCVYWGFRLEPALAVWQADRERHHGFLPEAGEYYRLLAEALPDSDCTAVSFSANNQRTIVRACSDREPGTFYLLDRATGKLGVIGKLLANLPDSALASSRTFEFKARDGISVTGRLTYPANVSRPPVVVRIGPSLVGAYAPNRYDDVAQFLASRGYASVMIQARGAGGLGDDFRRMGDLKITTAVVDDLEDGLAFLREQGWVSETRAAIMGTYSGGIVALHAALRGRFKVLINVGTPMTVQKWELEELCPGDRERNELTELAGGSAAALAYIKSVEPIVAAARLSIPSFHAYAKGEPGFDMVESGRLLKAVLEKTGTPYAFHAEPEMKPNTDEAKVTAARYEAIIKFLEKHL